MKIPASSVIKKGFLFAACLLVLAGCASSTPQPLMISGGGPVGPISVVGAASAGQGIHNVQHVVGPSETIWRISKTYGVDADAILRANNLTDPSKIKNGQSLLIPGTAGAKALIPLYPSNRWTHIVVHHTATDTGDAYTIDDLHHKRGWDRGLGYHFIIDNGTHGKEDGQIQVGPRWIKQMVGAHTKASNMNERGIGIAIVGNFSEKQMTQKEMDSLVFLVKTLQEYYGIPYANVIGHRDVPGAATECPGKIFPWGEFKRRIQ